MVTARLVAMLFLSAAIAAQDWVPLDGCMPLTGNVAFDRARGRAVLVGTSGEVYELDGGRALHRAPDAGQPQPGLRFATSVAFDEARGHVLMFGGVGAVAPFGDTWTWDGQWQQPFSLIVPPRRTNAAITYDPLRQRVLMFGGNDLSTMLNDTWEHDGSQWVQRLPATVPPTLGGPVMVFDRGRGVAVLVGAAWPTAAVFEWNGTDWTQRTSAGAMPPAKTTYGFCYDEARGRCVLMGGEGGNGDVWEWDGTNWVVAANVPDFNRQWPALWFDPALGQVVVAGGYTAISQRSDLWSWNGSVAAPIQGDRTPPHRNGSTFAWSPGDGRALMWGGQFNSIPTDLWNWDGTAWTRRSLANAPSGRAGVTTAADRAAGRLLMFGGSTSSGVFNDLWSWDGTAWTSLPQAVSPPVRMWPALAFDEARGVAVLFGGTGGALPMMNDTWEWNGAWSQRLVVGPPGRSSPAMAFDAARARMVLFGGVGGTLVPQLLDDTWEWDGSQWLQVAVPARPIADGSPSMVYDRARARIVMLAGQTLGPANIDQRLWDYDGVSWTQLDQRVVVAGAGLIYDERRSRVLSYDGDLLREWSTSPAAVAAYGAGCGAGAQLLARTRPRIGDPDFGLECTAAPGSAVVFGFGGAAANVPVGGGCNLLIGNPLATTLQLASVLGFAVQPVVLPAAPALRGLTLFAQAGALDPVTSALSLSAGLQITVGD